MLFRSHVPGYINIADLLSRGCSPKQMLLSKWWEGPSWLKESYEFWPVGDIDCQPKEVDLERKKTKIVNIDLAKDAPLLYVIDVSDFDKMLRIFAWILRFVNNCRKSYDVCKHMNILHLKLKF